MSGLVDPGERGATPGRRVAITGLGIVSPLGCGVETNWQALREGRSGVGPITRFRCEDFPSRIAGFTQYAIGATAMAVEDARFEITAAAAPRVGCIVGVGIGGLETLGDTQRGFLEGGLRRISPFFIPRLIANMAPGQIAIRFGARGVNPQGATAT